MVDGKDSRVVERKYIMPMYLKNIKLSNFKNYGEVEISFSHNVNLCFLLKL